MKLGKRLAPAVNNIFDQFKNDSAVAVQLTYKRFIGQKKDEDGNRVSQYATTVIPKSACIKLRHTEKSLAIIGNANSKLQVGSSLFMIKGDKFPKNVSLKDLVCVPNGEDEKVQDITPVFDLLYIVSTNGGKEY